jgi:hypothetical protein
MAPELLQRQLGVDHIFDKHGGPFVINASFLGGRAVCLRDVDSILEVQLQKADVLEITLQGATRIYVMLSGFHKASLLFEQQTINRVWCLFLVLSAPSLSYAFAACCLVVGPLVLRCCVLVQLADILFPALLMLCFVFYHWAVVDCLVPGCFGFLPNRCNKFNHLYDIRPASTLRCNYVIRCCRVFPENLFKWQEEEGASLGRV